MSMYCHSPIDRLVHKSCVVAAANALFEKTMTWCSTTSPEIIERWELPIHPALIPEPVDTRDLYPHRGVDGLEFLEAMRESRRNTERNIASGVLVH